jgi:Na+/H+ antiporter NhaD/arsenite permease-like protein
MIGAGMVMGFYSQQTALTSIDGNTILLLAAMMMVVGLLRPTGAFDYIAVRLAHFSRGDPKRLLVYLSLAVTLISMLLDNVTTVIVFAPLTILISRILQLNPMPFLIAEAILSNIGGTSTLVGDPPNIMISSAGNIDFTSFLIHMGPPIAGIWISTMGLLIFLFRKELSKKTLMPLELNHAEAIKSPEHLKITLLALGVIVVLFTFHHILHISPAYAAFIGLTLALLLIQPKPESLFGTVNWSVLIFFVGLFIIVGGVKSSGLLSLFGRELAELAKEPGMLLVTCLLLMWVSAILSAVVDNIPFTITMIPIILGLESQGVNIIPLWWALALGVGLGGNATHIGATANLIVITESEQSGIDKARITPRVWARYGIPTTLISICLASVLFTLFFEYFQ